MQEARTAFEPLQSVPYFETKTTFSNVYCRDCFNGASFVEFATKALVIMITDEPIIAAETTIFFIEN